MVKVWSMMPLMVMACLVAVSAVVAAEGEKGRRERPDPAKRFGEMEKKVGHDPLKGVLTKDELALHAPLNAGEAKKPNIVIVLADDMGWRDTGYSGNPVVKTPHLDSLAKRGIRFDNFYSAQQQCSPGRFAIMTGRNPFRVGPFGADHTGMPSQEVTIAQLLKKMGYATGHFGKWNLGAKASHPVRKGFDLSYYSPGHFDIGGKLTVNDSKEEVTVKGDSSVFAMDLALDFIHQQASEKKPFFAYVCFGSPHGPLIGAEEFKKLYDPDEVNRCHYNIDYLAEVTGVDAAVGKLCEELRRLGLAEDTIVWFTSDNGGILPKSADPSGRGKDYIGVRTVACMEWPGRFKEPIRTAFPCLHQDMLPTLIAAVGSNETSPHPLDGINLIPMLEGKIKQREKPMGFLLNHKKDRSGPIDFGKDMQSVWLDWPYKLVLNYQGGGSHREPLIPLALYHLESDPGEKKNVAETNAERVTKMRQELEVWQRSLRESIDGKDYKK